MALCGRYLECGRVSILALDFTAVLNLYEMQEAGEHSFSGGVLIAWPGTTCLGRVILCEGVSNMSYIMVMENPDWTQDEYDQITSKLSLDSPDAEWPQGCLKHFAGPSENGGWCVVDEWESKEDFQNFFENRLKP